MAFNPTPAQSAAIETKDRSLLISAAAGSGKTATLTQRIISSLTDKNEPADISRMLVVTFTRAAAAELRERITAAISAALVDTPSDPHLCRQALLVGSADICTIDSFCLDVVRANFQRLKTDDGTPLPPDFRLADESELSTLAISTMNATIDDWYDKPAEKFDFAAFAENFASARDDGTLVEALIRFSEQTSLYKNAHTFSKKCAEDLFSAAKSGEFFDSAAGQVIKELTESTAEFAEKILTDALTYLANIPTAEAKYSPAIAQDLKTVQDIKKALRCGYAATKAVLDDYLPLPLKSLGKYADDVTAYYKSKRDGIKKSLVSLRSAYYSFDGEILPKYMAITAKNARLLGEFTEDYRARLAHEKASRRICSFNDIKRLAFELLVTPEGSPTDIALALREKYEAVYIDEYQDVDPLQDAIFAAVARPDGRFMVGDIKQSIYGFRGSDPSIFGQYRNTFAPLGEKGSLGASIFMSENFRCDKPIIDFTNLVSRATFAPAKGAVDYSDDDDLINGKSGGDAPVKLSFILPPDKSSDAEFEIERGEIRYIVNEIVSLLENTKKNDGEPILPGDIAVLSRSTSLCAAVGEALAQVGVPTANIATKDYFENPEVLLLLSLVSAVADPHRDIRLAAALRSPVFGFSMDELVRIRRSSDSSCSLYDAIELYGEEPLAAKCREFEKTLSYLRRASRTLPVDRFVRELFDRFSLSSMTLENDPRSSEKIHDNILRFYEYARTFSQNRSGSDLLSFVKYIDDMIEAGVRTESESERSPDRVALLTVHKSKGLEFPVVFLCGCGTRFNRDSTKAPMLYDSSCGIGLSITDETGFARVDTPIRAAIARAVTDRETEEEMRILYVALTRARERLYITGMLSKAAYERAQSELYPKKYLCRYSVLAAGSFLDWLLPVALIGDPSFELSILASDDIPDAFPKDQGENIKEVSDEDIAKAKKIFEENFEHRYAHGASLTLPAKLSVSKLYPTVLDDDGAATLDESNLPELVSKPLFMLEDGEEKEKATAAERGTATHVFLQFCDFSRAERSVREELSRLTAERFIPEGTAALVNVRQLEKFFESKLYLSLKHAKKIYREQRFNLLLPAETFTGTESLKLNLEGENLLVQGVIDLVFEDENGDITLCDYKTDYLTKDELCDTAAAKKKLVARHGQQLAYYSEAVTRLFGRAPARVCIYSLPLGDTVEI
ncbi:MAG: hypothetical protein E7640_03890 [Ruminococcaceae bacterium]|nr:hypothetical protein [Oscillospiraceae bacterium]